MRSSLALCLCSAVVACGGGSDVDQTNAAAPMSESVATSSTGAAPDIVMDLSTPTPTPIPIPTVTRSVTVEPVASDNAVYASCGLNDAAGFQAELLERINAWRAAGAVCGSRIYSPSPALNWNNMLQVAAAGHASDMAKNNFFSHTGSDGSSFDQRIAPTGYRLAAGGENIAAGQTSVQAVISTWINSPGHCQNLMSSSYRDVGVACARSDAAAYSHYWTMDLGREQ